MKVRIEESDFVVTMEHIGSESNYRFGMYTPEIRTLLEDYIVPCLVAFGFQVQSIYDAMGEIASDNEEAAKAEEVPELPPEFHAMQYHADRMFASMCDKPSGAEQQKGSEEAEA